MYYRRLNMSNIKYNYDLWNKVWKTTAERRMKTKKSKKAPNTKYYRTMATVTAHTALAFMIGHQRTIGNDDNNVTAFHIEMIGIQCRMVGWWLMSDGKTEYHAKAKSTVHTLVTDANRSVSKDKPNWNYVVNRIRLNFTLNDVCDNVEKFLFIAQ